MPRLRPLKKAEDIAAVPADEPVMIEVSEEVITVKPEGDPPEKIEPEEPKEPEKVEPEPPEPDEEPEPSPEPPKPDEEKIALKRRVEELTLAEEASKRREANLDRERLAALQQADERTFDSLLNAIEANRSAADQAQGEYEAALADSNYKVAAEAQRKMSLATAQLVRLEEGKEVLEGRLKEPRAPAKEAPADPLEASIANLPDAAKTWLRTNRDYMTDSRKNAKIQALHWDVIDEGHKAFSPGYFESLETHLGMREKAPAKEPPVTEQRRTPIVSAPVSRDAPSVTTGKPMSTRVTLSPSERESAKISGISEQEYAKQKLKLEALKKEGHYPDGR